MAGILLSIVLSYVALWLLGFLFDLIARWMIWRARNWL